MKNFNYTYIFNVLMFLFISLQFSCVEEEEFKRVETTNLVLEWRENHTSDFLPNEKSFTVADNSITAENMELSDIFKLLAFDKTGEAQMVFEKPSTNYDITVYLKKSTKENDLREMFPEIKKIFVKAGLIETL